MVYFEGEQRSPHEFHHGVQVRDLPVVPLEDQGPRSLLVAEPIAVLFNHRRRAAQVEDLGEVSVQDKNEITTRKLQISFGKVEYVIETCHCLESWTLTVCCKRASRSGHAARRFCPGPRCSLAVARRPTAIRPVVIIVTMRETKSYVYTGNP